MEIILIFWNKPHLPLPTFLRGRWCSQVVEWGGLSHLAARPPCVLIHPDAVCRGNPPESCVWVPFALSESRGGQGKTPFVSQLPGSNQHRALGLRFSERQEKPFSKMRLSASSLFLGYRAALWWLGGHQRLPSGLSLCRVFWWRLVMIRCGWAPRGSFAWERSHRLHLDAGAEPR